MLKIACAFDIPLQLPCLNDFIKAGSTPHRNRSGQRLRGNAYGDLKRAYTEQVGLILKSLRLKPLPYPLEALVRFDWRERDMRRNPDNVAAGGTKIILDAMQTIGLIQNDGWGLYHHQHRGSVIHHAFSVVPKNPGVCVTFVTNQPNEEETNAESQEARAANHASSAQGAAAQHRKDDPESAKPTNVRARTRTTRRKL